MHESKIAAARVALKLAERSSKNGQFAYIAYIESQCIMPLDWMLKTSQGEWDRIVALVSDKYTISTDDIWDAIHWLEEYEEPMSSEERKQAWFAYWHVTE
jgi:hypothetical protein